jgi:hypothetical protein
MSYDALFLLFYHQSDKMTTMALAIISGPHKGKTADKAKRVAIFVTLKFLVAILKM